MTPTLRSEEPSGAQVLQAIQGCRIVNGARIDEDAVKSAYRRWAPVYDHTFGLVAAEGRKHSVEIINQRKGRVLEVGVGTGLSLPTYGRHLEIVGIDLSPEMLEKARERVADGAPAQRHRPARDGCQRPEVPRCLVRHRRRHVRDDGRARPREGHARALARVPPGRRGDHRQPLQRREGKRWEGMRGWVERRMAPFADKLGWRPVFDIERVLVCEDLDTGGEARPAPLGPVHDDALPQSQGGQSRRLTAARRASVSPLIRREREKPRRPQPVASQKPWYCVTSGWPNRPKWRECTAG